MKLGILINTDRHAAHVVGIVKAAVSSGRAVDLFFMDEGTRLLQEKSVIGLLEMDGVNMAYCRHTTERLQVDTKGHPDAIISGSQIQNAKMFHTSDRVIVL